MVRVGSKIRAADFPPSKWAQSNTEILNVTSTSYIVGSPTVETLFVAPQSGSVLLVCGGGFRDSSTNRISIAPQIRAGSSAGSIVLAADEITRGVTAGSVSDEYEFYSRMTLLTGLTAGSTYHAQALYKVSGGSSADIQSREIAVIPTPLGGNYAGKPVAALDYPDTVWAQDTTTISNPTNTTYSAGSPTVNVTFIAPTSGRVLVAIGGSAGNATSSDRIIFAPELRETNVSGTIIVSTDVEQWGWGSQVSAGYVQGSRVSMFDNLTPGDPYFVRHMYAVATDPGSQTQDINCREILVCSVP